MVPGVAGGRRAQPACEGDPRPRALRRPTRSAAQRGRAPAAAEHHFDAQPASNAAGAVMASIMQASRPGGSSTPPLTPRSSSAASRTSSRASSCRGSGYASSSCPAWRASLSASSAWCEGRWTVYAQFATVVFHAVTYFTSACRAGRRARAARDEPMTSRRPIIWFGVASASCTSTRRTRPRTPRGSIASSSCSPRRPPSARPTPASTPCSASGHPSERPSRHSQLAEFARRRACARPSTLYPTHQDLIAFQRQSFRAFDSYEAMQRALTPVHVLGLVRDAIMLSVPARQLAIGEQRT